MHKVNDKGLCYAHAMDLRFTLTSSIDFILTTTLLDLCGLWLLTIYFTLFDISFPFHFTISHIKSRIRIW